MRGGIRRRDVLSAEALDSWLQELVATHADRILEIDQGIAEQWGRFNVPDPPPVIDSHSSPRPHRSMA